MDRDLVVTVLFDFEYHASDGQRVHMHKDEEFLVIQQTNSDWWQVNVASRLCDARMASYTRGNENPA